MSWGTVVGVVVTETLDAQPAASWAARAADRKAIARWNRTLDVAIHVDPVARYHDRGAKDGGSKGNSRRCPAREPLVATLVASGRAAVELKRVVPPACEVAHTKTVGIVLGQTVKGIDMWISPCPAGLWQVGRTRRWWRWRWRRRRRTREQHGCALRLEGAARIQGNCNLDAPAIGMQ